FAPDVSPCIRAGQRRCQENSPLPRVPTLVAEEQLADGRFPTRGVLRPFRGQTQCGKNLRDGPEPVLVRVPRGSASPLPLAARAPPAPRGRGPPPPRPAGGGCSSGPSPPPRAGGAPRPPGNPTPPAGRLFPAPPPQRRRGAPRIFFSPPPPRHDRLRKLVVRA